jgi:magnesium transporter
MEWHEISDPMDPQLDALAVRFNLHPLHIEDCRHRNQIAKIENSGHYLFLVLKPVAIVDEESLDISDLDLFIGADFVITVQETEQPAVQQMIQRTRALYEQTLRPDQIMYRLIDGVVDSYVPVLDIFSDRLDEIETQVLEEPDPKALARIFSTKRCLIQVRRVLSNTREVAGHIQRGASPLIGSDLAPFMRDVYDHLVRNLDTVEMFRDLLTGSLDVYLSSVANRTNQVMKVLTVMGTLALPALVISGFYGMNFDYLPWMHEPWGAALAAGVMMAAMVGLLLLLRRLNWF